MEFNIDNVTVVCGIHNNSTTHKENSMNQATWLKTDSLEYELDSRGQFTGWIRRLGGPLPGDSWMLYNEITGEKRGGL